MSNNKKNNLQNLSDRELITKYHSFPIVYVLLNIITTLLFLLPLIIISNNAVLLLCFWAVGSVFVIYCNHAFSNTTRYMIAEIIKARHAQKGETYSGYYYIAKCEKEFYGKSKSTTAEKICLTVGKVLRVLNYLFYIIAAALVTIFSAIPLILSAFLCIAYVVFVGSRANGLAKACVKGASMCTIPLKLALNFLFGVLTFKGVGKLQGVGEAREYDQFFKIPTAKTSSTIASLEIEKFLSLSSLSLPGSCHWESYPSISASGTSVYVEGSIVAESFVYRERYQLDQLIDSISEDIKRILDPQIDKYLKTYPNVSGASVEVSIKGRIG